MCGKQRDGLKSNQIQATRTSHVKSRLHINILKCNRNVELQQNPKHFLIFVLIEPVIDIGLIGFVFFFLFPDPNPIFIQYYLSAPHASSYFCSCQLHKRVFIIQLKS